MLVTATCERAGGRPRVWYWTELFWPHIGGVEVHGSALAPALVERGYDLSVITSLGSLELPEHDVFRGIPIYRLPFTQAMTSRDPRVILRVRRNVVELKQRLKPDLIHLQLTDPSVIFHLLTRAVEPSAFLLTLHVALPRTLHASAGVLGQALATADWVTAVSRAALNDGLELQPSIAARCSVVYGSLDVPPVRPEVISLNPPTLICIGRLVPEKGFEIAIAALGLLASRYPSMRLVVVGDGPYREDLEALAGDLEVADRVDFKGWVAPSEVSAVMNEADIMLMPSQAKYESFGLSAFQAMQMGRPVVASGVPGLTELVVHERTGEVVPDLSPESFARAVARLIDDPERARRLGAAGQKRTQEEFSFKAHVDAYDSLYQELIGRRLDAGSRHAPPRQ